MRKDSIVAIILTKNRLDSKIQTYSLFAGTKMHGYDDYYLLVFDFKLYSLVSEFRILGLKSFEQIQAQLTALFE